MKYMEAETFLNGIQKPHNMVVLFTKEGCPHCDTIHDQIEDADLESSLGTEIYSVSINDELAKKYLVFQYPSIGVFKNGVEYYSFVGTFGNEDIMNAFIDSTKVVLGG